MIKDEILQFFSEYITKHTGITYAKENMFGLESRLQNIAQMLSMESVDAVYRSFKQHITPQMHDLITDIATNNETCFFRDGKPFQVLAKHVIPEIMKKNELSRTISIWSAACSTGQEPYSILMTLEDHCPQLKMWKVNVNATDLSPRVLKFAKEGVYNQLQIQRGLPILTLQKYFTQIADEKWAIRNDFRSAINFSLFNLLIGFYQREKYDIIFCRNVLIYQNIENRKNTTEKLYNSLTPGGYLFLGNGESMLRVNEKFEQKLLPGGTAFQRPVGIKENAVALSEAS